MSEAGDACLYVFATPKKIESNVNGIHRRLHDSVGGLDQRLCMVNNLNRHRFYTDRGRVCVVYSSE
jgi:hypothetical protein